MRAIRGRRRSDRPKGGRHDALRRPCGAARPRAYCPGPAGGSGACGPSRAAGARGARRRRAPAPGPARGPRRPGGARTAPGPARAPCLDRAPGAARSARWSMTGCGARDAGHDRGAGAAHAAAQRGPRDAPTPEVGRVADDEGVRLARLDAIERVGQAGAVAPPAGRRARRRPRGAASRGARRRARSSSPPGRSRRRSCRRRRSPGRRPRASAARPGRDATGRWRSGPHARAGPWPRRVRRQRRRRPAAPNRSSPYRPRRGRGRDARPARGRPPDEEPRRDDEERRERGDEVGAAGQGAPRRCGRLRNRRSRRRGGWSDVAASAVTGSGTARRGGGIERSRRRSAIARRWAAAA